MSATIVTLCPFLKFGKRHVWEPSIQGPIQQLRTRLPVAATAAGGRQTTQPRICVVKGRCTCPYNTANMVYTMVNIDGVEGERLTMMLCVW